MSMGSYYVPNKLQDSEAMEVYSAVSARDVSTSGNIPSGATIVQGIYYMWNDEGFTGKGWMYDIEGGPTNMYPEFRRDEDVAAYVQATGNLDAVFSHWNQHYTIVGWNNFYTEVGVDSGCMDVVHTE